MSLADDVTKKYMQDNAHFADLFNYYIYDGKPVINPDNLIDKDPTELCILSNGKKAFSKQKIRDILKSCSIKTDGHTVFVLMGIENQSDIHYAMTIKNLLYDALNYAEQADVISKKHRADKDVDGDEFLSGFAKTDTVTPVITITLYWGTKSWDAATRLSDMFPKDTPEEIRALATDYKLNLVTPENISDFRKLNTELGDMLESIKRCDDSEMFKNMIAERNGHWIISREGADLLNVLINAKITVPDGERTVDMCVATKALIEQGKVEGRAEGRSEGIVEGRSEGEERSAKLFKSLYDNGQLDDMKKAMSDPNYRNIMFEKLGL